MKNPLLSFVLCLSALSSIQPSRASSVSTDSASTPHQIERGSKVFIEPMDGFESYLAAAILKKNVPLIVVDDKAKADFIVSGTSHIERASWAKTIFISGAPQAGASISIKNAKSGDLVFAYAVDKFNAARANQSTAEACAKHLKNYIEKK